MSKDAINYKQIDMFKPLNNINYTYKSHNLIMSSYELSITEQRIIALACKKIKPIYIESKLIPSKLQEVSGALKFSNIEISVSEYKREYNITSNNIYDSLEQYTNMLYEDRDIRYFDENGVVTKKDGFQLPSSIGQMEKYY